LKINTVLALNTTLSLVYNRCIVFDWFRPSGSLPSIS
jgi:hypothetical protein